MTRVVLIVIPLFTAVVGGAVGGLLTHRSATPSPRPVLSADVDPGQPASGQPLADRVATLEREVARLERDNSAIRALKAYGAAIAARGATRDAGAATASPVDDPVFQAAVEDIIDRSQQQRRQQRMQRFAQRMGERLTSQLALDPEQQQKVAQAIADYMKKVQDLRAQSGSDAGLGRSARREQMQKLRKDARSQIAGALRSDQLDKFNSMDNVLPFGGRRGSRGPTGGGTGTVVQ